MDIKGLFRMWPAWVISLTLLVVIYYSNPQQIGVLLYKTSFISWGAVMGYWVDRWVFPYDRPHDAKNLIAAEQRRAFIVCAAMLSFALAV
jgi:hypothetical protein